MVSFWLNLFLSFTNGAVAENSDAYIVILQPGSLICERNFAARKCWQLDGNGQIEADSLLIPFQLTISSVNQIMPLESTKIPTPIRWSVVLVR